MSICHWNILNKMEIIIHSNLLLVSKNYTTVVIGVSTL